MAKDRKPGVKPANLATPAASASGPTAGQFNLLALAESATVTPRGSWLNGMPPDLQDEIRRTAAELAKRPHGSIQFATIAQVLLAELKKRGITLPSHWTIKRYFSEESKRLRAAATTLQGPA